MSYNKYLYIYCFLSGLLFSCVSHANIQIHQFQVSTYLNKNLLFPYKIDVGATPQHLDLKFDKSLQKFRDATTLIEVSSDIPESDARWGFTYNMFVEENTSTCWSFPSQTATQFDVMDLQLDGQTFSEEIPAYGLNFETVDDDGFIKSEKELTLLSKVIDEGVYDCTGRIRLEVELAL